MGNSEIESMVCVKLGREDCPRSRRIDEKIIASVPGKMEVPAPKGAKYIEGIGDVNRQNLLEAGITNVEELLEKGSTVQGRKEIVETTGISEKQPLAGFIPGRKQG